MHELLDEFTVFAKLCVRELNGAFGKKQSRELGNRTVVRSKEMWYYYYVLFFGVSII